MKTTRKENKACKVTEKTADFDAGSPVDDVEGEIDYQDVVNALEAAKDNVELIMSYLLQIDAAWPQEPDEEFFDNVKLLSSALDTALVSAIGELAAFADEVDIELSDEPLEDEEEEEYEEEYEEEEEEEEEEELEDVNEDVIEELFEDDEEEEEEEEPNIEDVL